MGLRWPAIMGGEAVLYAVWTVGRLSVLRKCTSYVQRASDTENIVVHRTKEYICRPPDLVFPCHLTQQPTRSSYTETTTNPYAHPWAAPRFARQHTDSTASAPDTWFWRE